MPTIVESIITEFRLDTWQFSANSQETQRMLAYLNNKMKAENFELERRGWATGYEIQNVANKLAGFLGITLSFIGFKNFIVNTSDSLAALGHLSHVVGISTQELSIWQYTIQAAQGDSLAFTNLLSKMTVDIAKYQMDYLNRLQPWMTMMINLGVPKELVTTNPIGALWAFVDIIEKKRKQGDLTEQQARTYIGVLTNDPGTQDLFLSGGENLRRRYEEAKRTAGGGVTEGEAQSGMNVQRRLVEMGFAFDALVSKIIATLGIFIDKLVSINSEWHLEKKAIEAMTALSSWFFYVLSWVRYWAQLLFCETHDWLTGGVPDWGVTPQGETPDMPNPKLPGPKGNPLWHMPEDWHSPFSTVPDWRNPAWNMPEGWKSPFTAVPDKYWRISPTPPAGATVAPPLQQPALGGYGPPQSGPARSESIWQWLERVWSGKDYSNTDNPIDPGPISEALGRPNRLGRENDFLHSPPSMPKTPAIDRFYGWKSSSVLPRSGAREVAAQFTNYHLTIDDNSVRRVDEVAVYSHGTNPGPIHRDIHREIGKQLAGGGSISRES